MIRSCRELLKKLKRKYNKMVAPHFTNYVKCGILYMEKNQKEEPDNETVSGNLGDGNFDGVCECYSICLHGKT